MMTKDAEVSLVSIAVSIVVSIAVSIAISFAVSIVFVGFTVQWLVVGGLTIPWCGDQVCLSPNDARIQPHLGNKITPHLGHGHT